MSKHTISESEVLDAWSALLTPRHPIVSSQGKTVSEMAALSGESYATMWRRVKSLVATGKLIQIGVRPGRGGALVYDIR